MPEENATENYRLIVSRDDFSKLLSLLKIFENVCTDCDIKGGRFRCRSNDRHFVIDMDLSSILEQNNLSLSMIKSKVSILKTFEIDDSVQIEDKNMIIECNDSNYEVADAFSRVIFRKPIQKYIDNQFVDDEEFSRLIRIQEENLMFSHTIINYLKKRISQLCQEFENDIECRMVGLETEIKTSTKNHESSSRVVSGITMNRDIGNKHFTANPLAFMLDISSDLIFNCYHVTGDVFVCKFEQSFYGVPITLFLQVKVSDI